MLKNIILLFAKQRLLKAEQGSRLDEYKAMLQRSLVDLNIKKGGKFHNPDAILVAMYRGIIEDVQNEHAVYERNEKREAKGRPD